MIKTFQEFVNENYTEQMDETNPSATEIEESINWKSLIDKPAEKIYSELKGNYYDPKKLSTFVNDELSKEQKKEFEKAVSMLAADKEKEEEMEKKNYEIRRYKEKIAKLTKEKSDPDTLEERKEKIDHEVEKLEKRIKNATQY